MRVDVISDFVCPWCFVGLNRLSRAAAMAARARIGIDIVWHPFLLNPDTPPLGEPYRAFMLRKFGSAEAVDTVHRRAREAARSEGLYIDFDALQIRPSTRLAHALVTFLQAGGHPVARLVSALFDTHFQAKGNIGEPAQLAMLLDSLTLPGEALERCKEAPPEQPSMARQLGVDGVPAYVFDGGRLLVGAHPAEALFRTIEHARR